MHRVTSRTYVGQPTETVTLTTKLAAGGRISVTLDGRSISGNTTFQLPSTAGSQRALQIALTGPKGASCVVGIATVDGGTDGDFLMCQTHSPAPVHFYSLSAAAAAAMIALGSMRGMPEPAGAARGAAPRGKSKKREQSKKTKKKGSGR